MKPLPAVTMRQYVFRATLLAFAMCAFGLADSPVAFAEGWRAGVAAVKITPQQPMWMSGYAGRGKPAEGTLIDLWAKALILEDARANRAVLVTLDLCGIDRALSVSVRDEIQRIHGLGYPQVALSCSHTHTGPVVGENLRAMYALDENQNKLVDAYTAWLHEQIVAVVGQAIEKLAPADVSWGQGLATFAVNRRANPEPEVPRLRAEGLLKGPVDHDVPVLKVASQDGSLSAVVFGYACHATVLDGYQWSGDYPGFAQRDLEQEHPGAVAMFWAGCGADQNPLPRRQVQIAEGYGRALADAVNAVLASELSPISGDLKTTYGEIDLPFQQVPSKAQLETDAASADRFIASRARTLLAQLAASGEVAATYPYPIQAWSLGSDLLWITLGGEVVVDYALRLKQAHGSKNTWVAGYTNDVMAYIPSRRVLVEGGYEGGGAMVYYGLPSPWAPEVEESIVQEVATRVQTLRSAK